MCAYQELIYLPSLLISALVLGSCGATQDPTPSQEGSAEVSASSSQREEVRGASECESIEACEPGAFACSNGRCQPSEPSSCASLGLGAECSFESSLDGVIYQGRCAFHGGKGGYLCAPDCTENPCAQSSAICHPVRPTGQVDNFKACIAPCTSTFECLGGAWECNSIGECVLPNESACVGKNTLAPCTFSGTDGRDYEGICSAPPPTIDGPPYYSDTNLCVTICDLDDPSTCDRFTGVCQPAEAHGGGSHPEGRDYGVCVAPVCDGDEDCQGGMFGCEEAICVVPSFALCKDKEPGVACERMVAGKAVPGFCSALGLCLPSCQPDADLGPGTCTTNPASTRCISFELSDGSSQGLCVPGV